VADEHLDRNVLSALQEVMEQDYPELLDTFLRDSEERLLLLKKAGDAAQLVETAHSFKGSSSNMGAVRLAELCGDLERRAKQESPEVIGNLVEKIEAEFAIVRVLYGAEKQRSLAGLSSHSTF
jgi:HPt (histidine-containing phosphotransfer) domain-containing protein